MLSITALQRRIDSMQRKLTPRPHCMTRLPYCIYHPDTGQPLPEYAALSAAWDCTGVAYKVYEFDPDEREGSEP